MSKGLRMGRGCTQGFLEYPWNFRRRGNLGTSVGRGETSGDQRVYLGVGVGSDEVKAHRGDKGPALLF